MNTTHINIRKPALALALLACNTLAAGAAWHTELLPGGGRPHDVAVTPDNRCYVAYIEVSIIDDERIEALYCMERQASAIPGHISWPRALIASSSPVDFRSPTDQYFREVKFAVNQQGILHLYYSTQEQTGPEELRVDEYSIWESIRNGNSWSEPRRVCFEAAPGGTEEYPHYWNKFQFAVTPGRYPRVLHSILYYNGHALGSSLDFLYANGDIGYPGEVDWQRTSLLSASSGTGIRDYKARIMVDNEGEAHVCQKSDWSYGSRLVYYSVYGSVPVSRPVTVYVGDHNFSLYDLAVDRAGAPKIIASPFDILDATVQLTLRYISLNTTPTPAWTFEDIVSGPDCEPVGEGRSLVFDAANQPHLVYSTRAGQVLNYAWRDQGGFHVEPAVAEVGGEISHHVEAAQLCLDNNGIPLMLYVGVTDQQELFLARPNNPRLNWTGEPEYLADGVNPGSGTCRTPFRFRVKYSDWNNRAPDVVRLHIRKAGQPVRSYDMDWVVDAQASYLAGRIYTLDVPLDRGSDYSYYFEAVTGGQPATGLPTQPQAGPVVLNSAPQLVWPEAVTGMYGDGADNNSPDFATPVNFRVNYKDADGDAPQGNVLQLYILDSNNQPVLGSPFTMTDMLLEQSLRLGKTYQYSKPPLPRGCYTYYFTAQDRIGAAATGDPTTARQSLCVTGLKIEGLVKDLAGQGWAGIRVDLDGAETKNTTTDAKGGYMFEVGQPGSYRVYVAAQQGLSFRTTPGGQPDYPLPAVTHSLSPLDFKARGYSIKGQVVSGKLLPSGLGGVQVQARTALGAVVKTATTDILGRYTLTLASPDKYTVVPVKMGYRFDPASRLYSGGGAFDAQNYTATAIAP